MAGKVKRSRRPKTNQATFSKNLQKIMCTLGTTEMDLHRKTGLGQVTLNHIVTGRRPPSLDSIVKILAVVPAKFEKLMGS